SRPTGGEKGLEIVPESAMMEEQKEAQGGTMSANIQPSVEKRTQGKRATQKTTAARRDGRSKKVVPEQLARHYGLDLAVLARASGIDEGVLASWPGKAGRAQEERLAQLATLLAGLAGVMRKEYIATWLQTRNEAAKGRTPLQLLEQGDFRSV